MSLNLNDEHELQVQSYLRFAKLKRDQHVRESLSVISDFRSDKLQPGEMYNYKDLSGLLDEMSDEMKHLVDKEIQHAYHTNALIVKILLSQAQANGLQLEVDVNALENEFLLKQIASSEDAALSRPASDFVRRGIGKIGITTVTAADPKLQKEKDEAINDLATAKERLRQMQEETTKMMRERTNLNNELNALKDQMAAKDEALSKASKGSADEVAMLQSQMAALTAANAGAASASVLSATEKELSDTKADLKVAKHGAEDLRRELKMREEELTAARAEMDGNLQNSKQFLQMKKLMQQKSDQVVELRKRLAKYEPESVASAD